MGSSYFVDVLGARQAGLRGVLFNPGRVWSGRDCAVATGATREEDVARLMVTARERFGRIDILHNNEGASPALGDASATDLEEKAFDRSLAVNLKATWLACKHARPALRDSRGSIVNIASMGAAPNTDLVQNVIEATLDRQAG